MNKRSRLGVLRETKNPPDKRVAVPPRCGQEIIKGHPDVNIYIQPSDIRCFPDKEYRNNGYFLTEDIRDCNIFMGVKEVHIPTLVPEKTYLFFSHTAKKQPHNRKLLKAIVDKKITLIDYEYLTDENNNRLVAFGYWAGVVGAYKCLRARGIRTDFFDLPPASQCKDKQEMYDYLKKTTLKPIKILITGGGRVAHGAMETISQLNIKEVSPEDFLTKEYNEAVVCRLDPWNYVERKDGKEFDLNDFFTNPEEYRSTFKPFTKVTDLYIACHFWDPKSPVFMTPDDYKEDDFKISIIADVSCDLNGPIPSTLRSSTIDDSFYGYDRFTGEEAIPFINDKNVVTVMAVDNLPGELPRDASEYFCDMLIEKVMPSLFHDDSKSIIERATIVKDGELTPRFAYLKDYLDGKE